MVEMGQFEKGHKVSREAFQWRNAVMVAANTKSKLTRRRALDDAAAKLLELACAGDMQAIRELGNRLDGQAVAITDHQHSGLTIVIQQGLADQSNDALVIEQATDLIEKSPDKID